MKITIESTAKIVHLTYNGQVMPARIWEGHTASGIPVHAFIIRVGAPRQARLTEFERELTEHRAPSPEIESYQSRMVL